MKARTKVVFRIPFMALLHAGSRLAVAALLIAGALAGCSSGSAVATHGGVAITGSTGIANLSGARLAEATNAWAQRYAANPSDRTAVVNYAAALQLSNQTDQSVAVLRKAMLQFPKDVAIASAYGKALAAGGQFTEALNVLRSAQRPEQPDWKLYSAEGAVLDQTGQTALARDRYQKALALAPGEPSVLNNLALSHLLAGELEPSEKLLRQAVASPKATSRFRQNLALVLGLQGKFKEAEEVARSELDPDQATANVAYIKSMLAQTNTWSQIKATDKRKAAG